ncbi:hypothetical protein KHP62_08920 [Rhodobacteraceae bacterium NNCM2]|nr:hypothetical protein [Coraliihabitans acroporae]
MPPKIRAMLTVFVIIASVVIWLFRDLISLDASPFLVFGLTAFMCFSVWLFPEVKKDG